MGTCGRPPTAQLRLLGDVRAPCNRAEYTWNACAGTSKIQHAGKKLKHFVVVAAVVGLFLGNFNLLCAGCKTCLRWLRVRGTPRRAGQQVTWEELQLEAHHIGNAASDSATAGRVVLEPSDTMTKPTMVHLVE